MPEVLRQGDRDHEGHTLNPLKDTMPKDEFISAVRCEGTRNRPTYLFDITLGLDIAGEAKSELIVKGKDREK